MILTSMVNGQPRQGSGAEVLDLNPTRPAEVLATFRDADEQLADDAVAAAAGAFPAWKAMPAPSRGAILDKAAAILDANSAQYGCELSVEEGKTLGEGVAEVQRAAQLLRYYAAQMYAEDGNTFPSPRAGERILSIRQPVGPVAVITPWNFPIAIPTWKIAPALAYGNTVVWKPAQIVPMLAVRLTAALHEAGLPDGVLNLVLGRGAIGSRLIGAQGIRVASFTGGNAVGQQLAALAASRGVRLHAELGGKNAAIVLADADLAHAAACIVSGAMRSTGQKCTATSRVVVAEAVHDELVDRVVTLTQALKVGDPTQSDVAIGPLASADQLRSVLGHFQGVQSQHARLVTGGQAHDNGEGGYFVQPTVYVDADVASPIFLDEVFGPAVAITAASSPSDALHKANLGNYGLSGAIFTSDIGHIMQAIDHFDVGILHVNSETPGADPHVPFGGAKMSGTGGREMGLAAREFFTETKTVYLQPAPKP